MQTLIDLRAEREFLAAHAPGAVNIPLEELAARTHELPAKETLLSIADPNADRVQQAAGFLQKRGNPTIIVPWQNLILSESGAARARLWQPNAFLIEALKTIGEPAIAPDGIEPRALDVACGSGRDAVYLALQGYTVDAIDLLPDALARAKDLGRRSGVEIHAMERDLEGDPSLPSARYQLVIVFRYLQRSLFPALRNAVAPGGYIVYETFHERNLETGQRPSSPAHLLKTGELPDAFGGFEIRIAREAVLRGGRYFSHLLAQKPRHC